MFAWAEKLLSFILVARNQSTHIKKEICMCDEKVVQILDRMLYQNYQKIYIGRKYTLKTLEIPRSLDKMPWLYREYKKLRLNLGKSRKMIFSCQFLTTFKVSNIFWRGSAIT